MYIVNFSLFIGILAFVVGFLLLFAPSALKKINDLSTKIIVKVDTFVFSYRVGLGVTLMLVSVFMFFMAYYYAKRY